MTAGRLRMQRTRLTDIRPLNQVSSERTVLTEFNLIWNKAFYQHGRAHLVEKNFPYPACLDETSQAIRHAVEMAVSYVIDDTIDEMIEAVIDIGG